MALNPDEQESQIVAPSHSPPPEQEYLDDAFPCGVDDYRNNARDRQGCDDDDEEMEDVDAIDTEEVVTKKMIMNTQLMPEQDSSHNLQQDSNKSFIEKTQFADIEKDTQSFRHQEQSAQKDIQNASFSSRSFVEETQFADIEIDTQANEEATQFANANKPFQRQDVQGNVQLPNNFNRHTNISPAKFLSRPDTPEFPGFKFGVAAHVQRKNHELPVQHLPISKVVAQPEGPITKGLSLPKGKSKTRELSSHSYKSILMNQQLFPCQKIAMDFQQIM